MQVCRFAAVLPLIVIFSTAFGSSVNVVPPLIFVVNIFVLAVYDRPSPAALAALEKRLVLVGLEEPPSFLISILQGLRGFPL